MPRKLADIPIDAEYFGDGPLWQWDEATGRWIDWQLPFDASKPLIEPTKPSDGGWEFAATLKVEVDRLTHRIDALLQWAGSPGTCKKCNVAVYWLRDRYGGNRAFDHDGEVHSARCEGRDAGPLFRAG